MSNELDAYLDPPKKPRDRVHSIASRAGIPPDLADDFLKVTNVESGHNINVRDSSKGAKGFGQVMPDRPGGTTRTIGRRKYNLKDPDQNIEAGLRYFAEGGNDPVARRLHYFGGPGARKRYERTGRIPNISDGNMSAAQYVKATGAQSAARAPQQSKGDLDDYLDPLDDYLDAPASTIPTPQTKPKRSRFQGMKAGVGGSQQQQPTRQPQRQQTPTESLLNTIGGREKRGEDIQNILEGVTGAVAGTGRQLANAQELGMRVTPIGIAGRELSKRVTGFDPQAIPSKIKDASQYLESAVAENEAARPAPTTFAGNVRRGVGKGVGAAVVEMPKLILGGRALGAVNLPVQGALARADEGVSGIVKGAAGGLVYHYGGALTGKAFSGVSPYLAKLGNSLVWIAGPVAEQQLIAKVTDSEAPNLAQSIGENIPFGIMAGMGAKGKKPQPVQVKEGNTVRDATEADLPKIVSRELEVVPPAVEAAERRSIQREFDKIKETEPSQRFYHTQYGNVVKATDQTGARKGKTKIYVEGNPEEIHYPKTVDLRGRGNERMVPIKEPTSSPSAEQLQQEVDAAYSKMGEMQKAARGREMTSEESDAYIKLGEAKGVLQTKLFFARGGKYVPPEQRLDIWSDAFLTLPVAERSAQLHSITADSVGLYGEKGHQRPVPIKESTSQPVEVLPEKPQQPPAAEGALPATPPSPRQGLTEPSANVQWMPSKETGLPESGRTEGQAARAMGLEITENPYRRVDPKDVEQFKPLAEEWEAGWNEAQTPRDVPIESRKVDRPAIAGEELGQMPTRKRAGQPEGLAENAETPRGEFKTGQKLPPDFVYHNTKAEHLEAIAKTGFDQGAFSDKPIDFGGDTWLAVRKADLPNVQEHQYGAARAYEPSFENQPAIPPQKMYLVDKRGRVIRALSPAESKELTTRNEAVFEQPSSGKVASPTTLNVEKSLVPETKVSEQPIKEVVNETTALVRPESTIVSEGAGLGALERGTEPAPSKRRTKPHDTLVTGERSDISLSQFVRKRGGIVPGEMFAGELDRLRSPDTGTTGLVNQRNVRGGRKMTADYMMEAANEAGFKDPQTGEKFDNVGNFLYAVERDVSTKNIKALTGTEVDFEGEYRKHVDAQMAEAKDRDNAIKSADALVSLLEGGRGGELFDKIAANNATPAEQAELRSLARKRFIRTAELEDVIAEAKAEGLSTSFEGERATTPSRTERAEQLGFVQEGLTQESAPPPKVPDQRERLLREEQERQATANPERTAALKTLADLRSKGMTVDEYARQGSLIGETPSRRKLALLRELESGNFGPGAASAKEPFPEVKERKFGKRFVEDERIVKELRDSIGTGKYYEVSPNKVTAEQAKTFVDEKGLGETWNVVRDEANGVPFHVRSVMGQGVILRLNRAYKTLKETNPKAAEYALDRATDMAEWAMDFGTRLGKGVQSFAMWSRLTPEGKLLTYKRAVDKARKRHSEQFGEDVKEIVDTVNKEMSHEERVNELKKLFTTNKTARKVRSQMDQLLKAAKDRKLEDKDFYDIVGDRLGLPKYDPEVASRIMSLAEQIADAPEGLPRDRKILQLNKYLAEQKGFDVGDLPIGIYYGNILSGYNTQIVNSVDTALNVISEINGLAINNPRAAAKIYGGLLRGFSEGKLDAILTLTEGRMVTDGKWLEIPRLMEIAEFGKKGGVPISTATRRGRAMKSIAESKAGYPLNAYKYVTRMLAASDAVMFRSAKEARAALLAHRMAEAEGLTGDALDAKVRSILALDRKADFEKQAEREGFTGTAAKVRTAELIDMARNKEISSDAADFAGEATYNHKPHGALGYASDVVGKWAERYKPLKLFVPFTRIVANVTNRGLNWTPYGFKRAAWGYSHGEVLTPEARRLMITRATLGTVGLVTLGALQEAGLLQIHGAGPSDREKKRQLQNAGWRPYSIQIGNTYISYVYSPTGLGLSIVGNMTDSQRYHELEQKDAATRGAYAIARLGSTVFSQSFLSGLSRLFNALSESPSESVSAVKQTMSSTVAAATTPNLARDVYRLFDNKAYQSNTLMEDLIRNTPFAALALKPQLNAFGEPVRVQRQRFLDVQTSDPAWQFVIQKGLKVPVPGRTLEIGKDERITPEQYYELLATTGPRVKQWVIANRTRLSRMKEDDAQDELQQAATRIRKFELSRMRLLARRKKVA